MTYVLTVNAPGYLPDCEPETFDTWREAVAGLKAALSLTWDSLMPDATDHTPHNDAHAEANDLAEGRPVSLYLVGLAHTLDKA
jgi:hypothetical protein